MEITRDQIKRFISNQCTAREAELIAAYLEKHPHIWDEWMSEEEWHQYTPQHLLNETASEALLQRIHAQKEPAIKRMFPFRQVAMAAAVLLLILTGWWLFTGTQNRHAAAVIAAAPVLHKDSVFSNNTARTRKFALTDGSVVILQPHSQISLAQPFPKEKRDIVLTGEALFEVANSKASPFTVYTHSLATTALGTVFTVTAWEGNPLSKVALRQGKVLVSTLKKPAQKQYLVPGQTCVFDNSKQSLVMERPATSPVKAQLVADQIMGDSLYAFNNRPLTEVMDILAASYHIPIHYSGTVLHKRKFTGRFSKQDNLEEILHTIGMLNDLQVTKSDTAYLIQLLP